MNKISSGVGLGFRRPLANALKTLEKGRIDFLELAPENWLDIGGKRQEELTWITEHYSIICHGLSLSLGSPSPLNIPFLEKIKSFLDRYNIHTFSEHLSYCSDQGYLYDLLPIPFTEEAVHYVADRIKQTQDLLERRIAIENISYYAAPGQVLSEVDFINAILEEAQCDLLLDVNNVFVNSTNHGYDAKEFLLALKPQHIAYIHIAGHYKENEELLIDSHGANIIDPVWELLTLSYKKFGPIPTLLERDFNIPPLEELLVEIDQIKNLQEGT